MKKRLNFLMLAIFTVLFSIVSCQKDEMEVIPDSTQRIGAIECIDFDTPPWNAGDIPNQVFTNLGTGPIMVNGVNPLFAGANAAMIFDSNNPTGNDPDLATATQNNILIISEDLDGSDPDDLDGAGEFQFSFGACGPVTVHSVTIIDVEGAEKTPYIEYFDATGTWLGVDTLPTTGNGGIMTVNLLNSTSNVDSVHVHLGGSGAIDDLCIEKASPPTGCTHTIGYWKNHAGFGPQADVVTPLLPIWLGTNGGAKSLAVTDRFIARDVLKMKTYGNNKNGITKLYAQLLATKLSIADGADGAPVAGYIADADAFLANNDWNDWNSLSKAMKKQVLKWKRKFDKYNNGLMGVPHCP
ncbi:MAG: hypothetical protein HKO56_06970 [Bacteroidia bacterium]|nr:hypothetical protein [Bacteroidia bacterium]NNC86138.1 hypothetical protein [Bacteroidia bacterium]NNM16382.1 hypothetical protein [Bacteroidia bacterium]